MDEALYQHLLQKMAAKGFNTASMIRTSQPITESESDAQRCRAKPRLDYLS